MTDDKSSIALAQRELAEVWFLQCAPGTPSMAAFTDAVGPLDKAALSE
jgi:hypothetical protein